MRPGRVEAPGKVVLVGEYAVLEGAPAVVAAVDRGVSCERSPAASLRIDSPVDDRFVRAALAEVGAPPARYTFADWNPVPSGSKVGLGGSAAATVAAVVAGGPPGAPPDEVFRVAFAVHHRVQGSGSGIDIAASVYGGVVRFQSGRVSPVPPVVPVVVFTGVSASTGPRVAIWQAFSGREAVVRESAALVEAFAAEPVRALGEAGRLLRAMAEQAGLPYWTDGTEALVRLARDHGGEAKPSGAGGGDIVVALFDEPDARVAYASAAAAAGFLPIEVRIAPGAVREG